MIQNKVMHAKIIFKKYLKIHKIVWEHFKFPYWLLLKKNSYFTNFFFILKKGQFEEIVDKWWMKGTKTKNEYPFFFFGIK